MRISVVIPHFNQQDQLRRCLTSLQAQQGCGASIEIIVVDNASAQLPEAVCAAFPGVRLLTEPTPGPGPARNTGARAAGGDVLAFIDADCHADPGWLAAIEARFRDPSCMIVGGDVRVAYADPKKPSFVEPYEAVYAYRNLRYIAEGFSGTGNLATRSEVMRRVGPFAGIEIAEDRDWGLRAGAAGYRIDYEPAMIVFHPARRSFAELARKWDRHIAHDHAERAGTPTGKAKWVLRALALVASPAIEIPAILRSDRLASWDERGKAFACLCLIRLYRGQAMLRMVVRRVEKAEAAWRRKT